MLPQYSHPISVIEQPSTKKKLRFRPFVVKEERLLLMAKETDNFIEILRAVKQVIQACCQEKDFNVESIPMFDLEYFFLKLRAISINNILRFSSTDPDDDKSYQHIVDLNSVEVTFPVDPPSNKIEITKDIVIIMKYPTVDLLSDATLESGLNEMGIEALIIHCMDKVFEKDTILKLTEAEKKEFLDNLTIKAFEQMRDFLLRTPNLEYRVHWTNSLGKEKFWQFTSLKDFFLLL